MTKKNRRSFTADFKMKAATLVLDQHYSIAEACRSMDVGETSIRKWVLQLQAERQGVTPKSSAITEDQRRIQEPEARVKLLELEKEILKKPQLS